MIIKGRGDSSVAAVGDLNVPLSLLDRTYRQKLNKEMEGLDNSASQVN